MKNYHWIVACDANVAVAHAQSKGAEFKISTTGRKTYKDNNQILACDHFSEDQNNLMRPFGSHYGRRRGEEVIAFLDAFEAQNPGKDLYIITLVTPFIYQCLKDKWVYNFRELDEVTKKWVAEIEGQMLASRTLMESKTTVLVGDGDVAGHEVKIIKNAPNPNKIFRPQQGGVKAPGNPYKTPDKRPRDLNGKLNQGKKDDGKGHLFPERGAPAADFPERRRPLQGQPQTTRRPQETRRDPAKVQQQINAVAPVAPLEKPVKQKVVSKGPVITEETKAGWASRLAENFKVKR